MKYLAHSTDASYDSTTKKWTFDLGRRVPNPVSLVLSKACFTVPTNYQNPPHVVYLRSDALSRMITRQHTAELKHNRHTAGSNILAVLSETHTRGRYRAYSRQQLPVDPNYSAGKIDFYFTDGNTIIDGAAVPAVTPVSDEDIVCIAGDLLMWLDFHKTRVLNSAFAEVENAGDTLYYIYNRSPAPTDLAASCATSLALLDSAIFVRRSPHLFSKKMLRVRISVLMVKKNFSIVQINRIIFFWVFWFFY